LNTDGCWDALIRLLDDFAASGLMKAEYRSMLEVVQKPEELTDIWKNRE